MEKYWLRQLQLLRFLNGIETIEEGGHIVGYQSLKRIETVCNGLLVARVLNLHGQGTDSAKSNAIFTMLSPWWPNSIQSGRQIHKIFVNVQASASYNCKDEKVRENYLLSAVRSSSSSNIANQFKAAKRTSESFAYAATQCIAGAIGKDSTSRK